MKLSNLWLFFFNAGTQAVAKAVAAVSGSFVSRRRRRGGLWPVWPLSPTRPHQHYVLVAEAGVVSVTFTDVTLWYYTRAQRQQIADDDDEFLWLNEML